MCDSCLRQRLQNAGLLVRPAWQARLARHFSLYVFGELQRRHGWTFLPMQQNERFRRFFRRPGLQDAPIQAQTWSVCSWLHLLRCAPSLRNTSVLSGRDAPDAAGRRGRLPSKRYANCGLLRNGALRMQTRGDRGSLRGVVRGRWAQGPLPSHPVRHEWNDVDCNHARLQYTGNQMARQGVRVCHKQCSTHSHAVGAQP